MQKKDLTLKYLEEKVHQYRLTPQQKEIFLLKFGTELSNEEIANRINISKNACIQCLGEIYNKFGIQGRSRGKAKQLLSLLISEFEQLTNSNISTREIFQQNSKDRLISQTNFDSSPETNPNALQEINHINQLRGINFQGANFTEANFINSDLRGADLRGSNFQAVNLTKANLIGADLRGCNFQEANFQEANLSEANFIGTNFKQKSQENTLSLVSFNILKTLLSELSWNTVEKIFDGKSWDVYGEERIRLTTLLIKLIKAPIISVSSGDIANWWNTDTNQEFMQANIDLASQGIFVKRIFIIDKSNISDEMRKIIDKQSQGGIETITIDEDEAEYLENYDLENNEQLENTTKLHNFLVCGDIFTTGMVSDYNDREKKGLISFQKNTIAINNQRFNVLLEKSSSKEKFRTEIPSFSKDN